MAKKQSKSNTQQQTAAKVTDNTVPADQPELEENPAPAAVAELQDQSQDDQTQVAPESKDDSSPSLGATVIDVVRVTSPINVGEKTYQPNNLVKNLPVAAFDTLLKKKRISQCEAGIKYCKDTLQEKVIDHAQKQNK